MRKENDPRDLSEEIERNFDNCWDINYSEAGGEAYFSTSEAIIASEKMVREIATGFQKWMSKKMELWMASPEDFPEMSGSGIDPFDIYLAERYERK